MTLKIIWELGFQWIRLHDQKILESLEIEHKVTFTQEDAKVSSYQNVHLVFWHAYS